MSLELKTNLERLHFKLRKQTEQRWNRVLPFQEEISDRWERARFLGFGENTSIYEASYIFGDVKVGKNTWIGPFTILDGSGGLQIGDFCSISSGVQIYTHDTVEWAVSGGKAKYEYARVRIGNCCYIGPLTVITKGVTVGDHSVVGANSLVNESLPSKSIAFGTPATVVGRVASVRGEMRLLVTRRSKKR